MKGVSICLSAYKVKDYIEECLDSISKQTYFEKTNNYEILLGIDGCEETLAKVNEIKHKYTHLRIFMMNHNVGTYIVANTIMSLAKYDILIRFDTDDIMRPEMVEEIVNNFHGCDVITYNYQNFGNLTTSGYACGSHALTKDVFIEYGGYQAWRCAADYDFLTRMQGVKKEKHIKLTYLRRVHENSLEFSKETDMNSKLREEYHNYIKNETKKHRKIKCVTSEYKELSSNISIGKIYNNEKGVISLTSWKKRINSVHLTIENLLEKCPNYHIVLVLSEEEFQNREKDLPKELLSLLDRIEILWVYKNYKAFKKILFTMDKYRDVPIISADDDCIYFNNYADTLYNTWKANMNYNHIFPRHKKMVTGCGACSLYSPYCFRNAKDLLTDEIINTIEDDMFYQYLVDRLSLKQMYLVDKWPFKQANSSNPLNKEYTLIKSPATRKIENYKIYDNIDLSLLINYTPNVNVNITTYPKRDMYLYDMLKNLKQQTVKPTNIILWLAREEYDENHLPSSILKCVNEKLLTSISFCEKNIYCHKRYETMKYNYADYNIFLDDDTIYESTFLEELIKKCKSTNNITCYYSFVNDFVGTKRLQYTIKKTTDKRKIALQGCTICWPPKSFPRESFIYEKERDIICPKCDETWLMSFLIKNNITIDYIGDFLAWRVNKDFKGTDDSALWKTMSSKTNDIEYRVQCFATVSKFLNIENKVLELWPKFDLEKCCNNRLLNAAIKIKQNEKHIPVVANCLLCAIVKNENLYIEEWVKHYQSLGVNKIVIYDNDNDKAEYVENVPYIKQLIDSRYIDVYHIPDKVVWQKEAYTECYQKYNKDYDWLMFFDVDEYLILENSISINEELAKPQFVNYDMIHVNWKIYDDNNIIYCNNDYSIVKRFTHPCEKNQRINKEIKSIIRGGLTGVKFTMNPHTVTSKIFNCCDPVGNKISSVQQYNLKICHREMWLNHYICKTAEEFIKIKLKRMGGSTKHDVGIRYNVEFFFTYNDKTPEKIEYIKNEIVNNFNQEDSQKILKSKIFRKRKPVINTENLQNIQTKENTTIKVINKPTVIKTLEPYKLPIKSIIRRY